MDKNEIKSVIESLLFTWGDPLEVKDLASILEIPEGEVSLLIKELMDDLDYNRRGVRIIKINNSYQIGTRPEHYQWIKKLSLSRANKNLSNAALETLSIVAYRQPIIKADMEAIRGVKCDRVLQTLIERKMVCELGRLERTGRPIIYGTTEEFLRSFGLESIDDLPSLNEVEQNLDLE
jgi:segregation and condensation protein B